MRLLISLALIIFLSACASTANYYTSTLNSWRGSNANALVKTWGTPNTKIVNPNGTMVFVYKTKSYAAGRTQGSPAIGVNVSSAGRPVIVNPTENKALSRNLTITCLAVFQIDKNGRISSTEVRGKGCYGDQYFAQKLSHKR